MQGAAGPTYLRSDHDENFEYKEKSDEAEYNLHVTGLREKRLWILIIFLFFLSSLAIIVLILNIAIIRILGMSTRGMKHLQFHTLRNAQTGSEENIIQFTAENVHLGKVIVNSGIVNGAPGKDLSIYGSRVIIDGLGNKTQFTLHDGICTLNNVDQFMVKGPTRPYFSAKHPVYQVDRRIKKLSTNQIITNKVRSPINENLLIDVENLSIRGNEGVRMEAKRTNISANIRIELKTSKDGRLALSSNKVYIGSNWLSLPISSSPALTASVDAYRVCICTATRPKLFVVNGNKPCVAPLNFCL